MTTIPDSPHDPPAGGHHYSTNAAAAALGVTPATIRRWAESGALSCYRTPGGHRRFHTDDLDRLRNQGTPADTQDTAS